MPRFSFPVRVASAGITALLAAGVVGCTGTSPQAEESPSPSATSSPLRQEKLTPRQRLRQLAALAPPTFDAQYRLRGKGPRPDAKVRMRTKGDRFRLEVQRGRSTALLVNGRSGVVSCEIEDRKEGKSDKSCFLVSKSPKKLPKLFDPQIQRLFRSTTRMLAGKGVELKVKQARGWRAPRGLGDAECYMVRGKKVEDGTYCYVATPGKRIGILARAVFPSGRLELRDVKQVRNDDFLRPPVRPTPLPTQG